MPQFSTVERAFQLAKSGPCATIADIQQQLKSEGYPNAVEQISYPSVRKQLNGIIQSRTSIDPIAAAASERTSPKASSSSIA